MYRFESYCRLLALLTVACLLSASPSSADEWDATAPTAFGAELAQVDFAQHETPLLDPILAGAVDSPTVAIKHGTISLPTIASIDPNEKVAPIFNRQGFGLGDEYLMRDARTFESAFFTSILSMALLAVAIALRGSLYAGANRLMEMLVLRLHGERQSHRRRRRPSASSKYASLSHYLNGGSAGRRHRSRRSEGSSRRRSNSHADFYAYDHSAGETSHRDRVVDVVVFTNGFVASPELLICGNS